MTIPLWMCSSWGRPLRSLSWPGPTSRRTWLSPSLLVTIRSFSSLPTSRGSGKGSHGISRFDVKKRLNDVASAELKVDPDPALNNFVPFQQMIEQRRNEAKRSLVVQVKSMFSAEDLYLYCSKHLGRVSAMFYHRNQNNRSFSDFYVIEFESRSSIDSAWDHCRHRQGLLGMLHVPVYSPFLWFSGEAKPASTTRDQTIPVYLPLYHDQVPSEEEVVEAMSQARSMTKQIMTLYEKTKMSPTSSRIRFLACEQIELAISGMFPKAKVLPFGSSVNSYGTLGSDLDMALKLDDLVGAEETVQGRENEPRLIFQAKGAHSDSNRSQGQRYCYEFANIIQAFLPGCQNVQTVLGARVPIIKYYQQLLDLECDVSANSLSGHYMSELLYLYGELDSRVRPLVFVLRKWAKGHGLIKELRPTPLLTNFSLTLLVIFHLQFKHRMLPSIDTLARAARSEDHRVCDDGVDCTFLRDINGSQRTLNQCYDNTELTVTDLLVDFFAFYSRFKFDKYAVCTWTGEVQPKRSAHNLVRRVSYFMDITNPLERELNASANVTQETVNDFQSKCKDTHEQILAMLDMPDDDQRLWQLLDGSTNTKLRVFISNLGWDAEPTTCKSSTSPGAKVRANVSSQEIEKQRTIKKRSRVLSRVSSFYPKY